MAFGTINSAFTFQIVSVGVFAQAKRGVVQNKQTEISKEQQTLIKNYATTSHILKIRAVHKKWGRRICVPIVNVYHS